MTAFLFLALQNNCNFIAWLSEEQTSIEHTSNQMLSLKMRSLSIKLVEVPHFPSHPCLL